MIKFKIFTNTGWFNPCPGSKWGWIMGWAFLDCGRFDHFMTWCLMMHHLFTASVVVFFYIQSTHWKVYIRNWTFTLDKEQIYDRINYKEDKGKSWEEEEEWWKNEKCWSRKLQMSLTGVWGWFPHIIVSLLLTLLVEDLLAFIPLSSHEKILFFKVFTSSKHDQFKKQIVSEWSLVKLSF